MYLLAHYLFQVYADREDEMRLIWDYERGFVIDAETGEVVEQIYEYSQRDVSFERGIGRKSELERIADEGIKILKDLKARGLSDKRGTYVAYKLGLSKKTVKSLKAKDSDVEVPREYLELYRLFLSKIEKDPLLSSRPEKSKKIVALAASMVVRGKSVSEVSKELKVNEKTLRRALKLLRSRI